MKILHHNRVDISIQDRCVSLGSLRHPRIKRNYFLIHTRSPQDLSYVLRKKNKLRTLHRNFGQPSVKCLRSLIKRAEENKTPKRTLRRLDKSKPDCHICRKLCATPRRFKLTIATEGTKFNHRVQFDTKCINGRAVLPMVDEAPHLCAAAFLQMPSTSEIWKTIRNMWSLVYLGPPAYPWLTNEPLLHQRKWKTRWKLFNFD